jgi:K+-sensing histidine kinase KdpD
MIAGKECREGSGERHMWIVKGAVSVAISLAVMAAVTAVLWYAQMAGIGPHHPVFFYLLPIVLVAILYGSRAAVLCAAVAMMCSAFFLYDPIYSFRVSGRLELGDLICFGVLALIGVKCTGELLRPPAKIPAAKSRYGQP